MKILFVGDSPTVSTGFGVVAANLLTRLRAKGYEIDALGVNYFGGKYDREKFDFEVWPTEKGGPEQIYSYNRMWWLAQETQPDLIFFLNDPWVIADYLRARPKGFPHIRMMAYYPTDAGPLKKVWAEMLTAGFEAQVCYSHYAEEVVIAANGGKRPENLYQVYHGIDRNTFKPINYQQARLALGVPIDAFIVGMVARNQFRKRFDILMEAFAEFAKDKPDAMLYIHTAMRDIGYDIGDLSDQFELSKKLIMTDELRTPVDGIPDSDLNIIYNTFDVNALISLGDGFGLPVAESMATGCPQLVSDHSCLKELVDGHGGLTVKTAAWVSNTGGINTWGGISDVHDLVDKLNILYQSKDLRVQLAQQGYDWISQEQFGWDYAADKFDRIIRNIFHIL